MKKKSPQKPFASPQSPYGCLHPDRQAERMAQTRCAVLVSAFANSCQFNKKIKLITTKCTYGALKK